MFSLFSKKKRSIYSIGAGKTIDLKDVEDEAFSSKALGEGIAIDLEGNIVHAPVDGEVSLIFKTKHAFGIHTDDGLDILVHIGFDTVKLGGEGFKALVSVGDKVKKGTPIIEMNKEFIESKGYSTTTAVVITNLEKFKGLDIIQGGKNVSANDEVIKYSV